VARDSVLFVVDSESQLKPAYVFACKVAERLGGGVAGNLVPGATRPSRRQITGAKIQAPMTFHGLKHLLEGVILDFGAVVAFLPGSRLLWLRTQLRRKAQINNLRSRPILVTGYNGVVYEGALGGILWRIGYDVVAVNSRRDMDVFEGYLDQLGVDASPLVRSGLMLAQITEPRIEDAVAKARKADIGNVLFACQAVVPSAPEERLYLLERLRDYAMTHPERGVFIKPRARPDERTFHEHPHHYELLYKEAFGKDKPENLHFAYGSFRDMMAKTDLVITVSSTGLLEGLAAGVPGAILTDCGIKEEYGNHFFVGSGLMTTMDDLIANRIPEPNMNWLHNNGFAEDDTLTAASQRVAQLVAEQNGSKELVPFRDVYYTPERAPYVYGRYLPRDTAGDVSPEDAAKNKLRKLVLKPDLFFADAFAKRATKFQQRVLDRYERTKK